MQLPHEQPELIHSQLILTFSSSGAVPAITHNSTLSDANKKKTK